ncbi:MAG: PAS domain-containing protein [Gemmatimonadota bacterium]|nr:MAG: PAS domain-containing protein [Gemmatimonadota bacterium]
MSKRDSNQLEPTRFAHSELLDALPDAIVIVAEDGAIINANLKALVLLGYERHELLGQPVEQLIPERFRDAHVGERERYRRNPHVRQMGAGLQIVTRTKAGQALPVEISLAPYQTADGWSVVCVIREVVGPQ